MRGRAIIKWSLSGIMVATVVGYSCFVLYDYLLGPRIVAISPESGFSTTTPAITVMGRVEHASTLLVNDAGTPSDLKGNFSSQLILAEGYNIIKVTAKDHYGRVVKKTIELTLMPQPHTIVSTTTANTLSVGKESSTTVTNY